MDTLVLTSTYQPIRTVPWFKSISWALRGRVEIVEEYDDRPIPTFSRVLKTPAVVRFPRQSKGFFRKNARYSRRNVWLRDRGICQYCGVYVPKSEHTVDHVIPKAQGGRKSWDNIVTCCRECNQLKADRTPEQAGMRLKRLPEAPGIIPAAYLGTTGRDDLPVQWRAYLS